MFGVIALSTFVDNTRYVPFFFKLRRLDDLICKLYDTIKKTMNPMVSEKIMEVILFRSLWAVRFFRTSIRMLDYSKERRVWVRAISKIL